MRLMKKSSKTRAKNKIVLETIMVFFIALAPFLYKVYEYLPLHADGKTSLAGIAIGSHGFPDALTYIWFLTSKFVPLYLLLFWFLTSRDWWYHIILIPIAMYSFQLFEVVFDSDDQIDTENILWLLPICIVVIPFVYLIRIKLYDKHVNGIDLEAMDAELEAIKSNPSVEKKMDSTILEQELESLKQESFADEIDRKLSTSNIEQAAKQFQLRLQNLLFFGKD